jgi:hypothetical protein
LRRFRADFFDGGLNNGVYIRKQDEEADDNKDDQPSPDNCNPYSPDEAAFC